MDILIYPNEILSKPCEIVTEFNQELSELIKNMSEAMLKANGIGLSANQVGILKSLFIMKDTKGVIHEFINPKLLELNGNVKANEGCLSAPGIFLPIIRPETVVLEFQNKNGEHKKIYAEGIEARCIQHEMEHLIGDFYFNRVNRQMRKAAISTLRKRK
jgi:peptide deformylase